VIDDKNGTNDNNKIDNRKMMSIREKMTDIDTRRVKIIMTSEQQVLLELLQGMCDIPCHRMHHLAESAESQTHTHTRTGTRTRTRTCTHTHAHAHAHTHKHTHTHTHPFNGPFPGLPGKGPVRER